MMGRAILWREENFHLSFLWAPRLLSQIQGCKSTCLFLPATSTGRDLGLRVSVCGQLHRHQQGVSLSVSESVCN